MHSVKNRFLLRIKNITPHLYRRSLMAITGRDLLVIGACLLREHSSLKAFGFVLRNWKSVMAKRREIMSRRRAPGRRSGQLVFLRAGEPPRSGKPSASARTCACARAPALEGFFRSGALRNCWHTRHSGALWRF